MDFLTPEFFNVLVIVSIIISLSIAGLRFYHDMTRQPMAYRSQHPSTAPMFAKDDTQPHSVITDNH